MRRRSWSVPLCAVLALWPAAPHFSGAWLTSEGEPEERPGAGSPAGPADPTGDNWSVTPTGGITAYFLRNSHARFGDQAKEWTETSSRLGTLIKRRRVTVGLIAIGAKTIGDDPFGTGTAPPGSPPGTPAPSTAVDLDLEEAYVKIEGVGGRPLRLTLGRQPILIGTQFLIGDGVYDGFSADSRQVVYHNPRRSFDALRVEWDAAGSHFDSFAYRVDPTWDGGGERNGVVMGLDVSRSLREGAGACGADLFYRSSPSAADNDMAVLGLRGERRFRAAPGLFLSGEFAMEFGGRCRNAAYCTTIGQRMSETAWHLESGHQAAAGRFKPFAEVGYVFYSDDFTPIATGFSDWGRWYLGNQIDWILFGTNTRIARVEAGLWPHPKMKLRLQYHNTREVVPSGASTGGTLSDELGLIAETFPRDWLWTALVVGYSRPGRALADSGLANPFQSLNSGASQVGTRPTLDLVVAAGITF